MSEFLDAALALAELGYHVFPCTEGGKVPACEHGVNDATTDPEQLRKWWTINPNYNIGVAPARSEMSVLDVDGPLGVEALARLEGCDQALPNTLKVQTPRGAGHIHYWFDGVLPSTVAKLGAKLDTRSQGGYVLVPPSRTPQGEYTYIGDTDEIAQVPHWIKSSLASQQTQHQAPEGICFDEPSNVSRGIAYLRASDGAVKGQGGDALAYQVVCGLLDFRLSEETAFKLLQTHFIPRCVPSGAYCEEFIKRKLEHAQKYRQNDIGAYAQEPPLEAFAHYGVPEVQESKRRRFYPMDEAEQAELKEPTWLLPGIIPAHSLVLMVGQFDSYKSFLALDLCLTLASGLPGWECEAREPACVLYAPSEGMHEIARRRKPAWKLAREITDKNIPFYMVEDVPWLKFENDIADFIAGIKERKIAPKLIVIDTVASAMLGLDENNAHDIGHFVQAAKTLKQAFNCTVLAVHHLGKDKERGSRGSSALPAGFDVILAVEAQHITKTVVITVQKMKDAERRKKPWLFQGDVCGPSLVFSPLDLATYRAMNAQDDTLGHARVAEALRSLGALSEANAITTRVLATTICPTYESDTHETYDRAVRGFVKELNQLAKGKLAAFVTEKERGLGWYIPAQASEKRDDI